MTVDSMEPFVKTTYVLEGDGPHVVVAYEHLMTLFQAISAEHYPNVAAVAQRSLPMGTLDVNSSWSHMLNRVFLLHMLNKAFKAAS